ncbi:MAG: DUF481 domain-containing protein, partial [Verrucomicrobiota bacterium]
FTDFWHDDIADLRYRLTVNPLLGVYLIRNQRTTLAFEGGPAWVSEEQGGIQNDYLALRFAQRFQHRLNNRMRIWQSFEYMPEVNDFGNYILIGEAGVETALTPRLRMKAFVQNRHDSQPAAGLEKDDLGVYLAMSLGMGDEEEYTQENIDSALSTAGSDWTFVGSAGASYLTGNNDSTLVTAALDGMRRWDTHEFGAGIFGGYAESAGATLANKYGAYLFYNEDLTPNWYAGGRADFLHDDIANIDYRVFTGAHLGYRIIDTDRTSFKLEGGLGYLFENQFTANNYLAVRFGEYFNHQVNDVLSVFQSFEYFSSTEDFNDYYLVNKVGFDTAIFRGWAWSNSFTHVYDSTPAPGLKSSDMAVISGLKWTF